MPQGLNRTLEVESIQDTQGYDFVGKGRDQTIDVDTLKRRLKIRALEASAHRFYVQRTLRVLNPHDDQIGLHGEPEGYLVKYRQVGSQHKFHRLVVDFVQMKPLGVNSAGSQLVPSRLEELMAEQHFDATHPGVARLGDDNVVKAIGPEQAPVRIAPMENHLGAGQRRLIAHLEVRRRVQNRLGDLGNMHFLHIAERRQFSGGYPCPIADHKAAPILLGKQGGDQRSQCHGGVVADQVSVGLAVGAERETRPFIILSSLADGSGGGGAISVKDDTSFSALKERVGAPVRQSSRLSTAKQA